MGLFIYLLKERKKKITLYKGSLFLEIVSSIVIQTVNL